jgi:prepilin-type N-terminal cleavage/methylation domain-containing protein
VPAGERAMGTPGIPAVKGWTMMSPQWARGEPRVERGARARRKDAPGGFTMIELTLVMSVLLVAFLALSQSLVTSMALTRVNRESALATDGLRRMVETLQGSEDFDDLFALYNSEPGDDPGPGPAPGSTFQVEGLEAAPDDPDGIVGEIVFPAIGGDLYENLDMPELSMPRDLDGDGGISMIPVGEYRLLPVLVRLRWSGISGERTAEVRTLIADR